MILESEIERCIVDAVDDLEIPGLRVFSSWQMEEEGDVAGIEHPDDVAVLYVEASAPVFESFLVPKAGVEVSMSLSVRSECDADKSVLFSCAEALKRFLLHLHFSVSDVKTLFGNECFAPVGLSLGGGVAPRYDGTRKAHNVTMSLTVRGVVKEETINELDD